MPTRVRAAQILAFPLLLPLLLPFPARAGEDIARLGPDEILEIEIHAADWHYRTAVHYQFRVQGGPPGRLAYSFHGHKGSWQRVYDSVLTPAMVTRLQLWIDLYREAGLVRDTLDVPDRFVLRRYAGGKLVQAEKRFDPDRTADRLIAYFTPELPADFVPDGWQGIHGWYFPPVPPDTARLGRLRMKVADPERYRALDYPGAWIPRKKPREDSARARFERTLESLDSLSESLE